MTGDASALVVAANKGHSQKRSRFINSIWGHIEFCRWRRYKIIRRFTKGHGWAERLKWFYRGFFFNKVALYPFDRYDWRLFLSDRQVLKTFRINGYADRLLEDKMLFQEAMSDRVDMPEVLGFKRHGGIQWKDDSIRDLEDLIHTQKKIIVKPIFGAGGSGVFLLESREGDILRNDAPVSLAELESEIVKARDIMFCEYLRQGAFSNSIYPRTVNTIRMITMLDPDDGSSFMASACLRIGQSKSFPVDNASSGGVFCALNHDTGKLGKAASMKGPSRWLDTHPDTGVVFEEQSIPNWDGVCREVLYLAMTLPGLPHIAWDIALLDEGISIIEANGWSSGAVFQMEAPMLIDPRIKKFYQYHGVI